MKLRGRVKHIQTKILTYFMIVLVVMAVGIFAFLQVSMRTITGITVEGMENVLGKINLDTSNTLAQMEKVGYLIARDSDVQKILREELQEDEKEMYSQSFDMFASLRYVDNLDGIYVIGENGAKFHTSFSFMLPKDFRKEAWYQQVKETQEPLWSCSSRGSFMIRNIRQYTISVVVPIIDRASYNFLGTVTVDIKVDDLNQLSQNGMVFDGQLMILDTDGQILYSAPEKDEAENTAEDIAEGVTRLTPDGSTQKMRVNGTEYLISAGNLGEWYLVGIVPALSVFNNVYKVRTLVVVITLICFAIAIFLSVSVSQSIAKPILKIRNAISKVENGDLDAQAEILTNDEVGMLAVSFNHMVVRIKELIREVYEKEEKLRIAEFNSLQAQINPHFLYNTLDSINWIARMGDTEEVSNMINSLSIFFRIGLSRGSTFITVDDELKHVENYIKIQQKRYQKYLTYEIDAPEGLKGYQSLKMILQPLVENSIYHGIKEKGTLGLIRITVREKEQELIFTVSDTGKGMTPEKLKELQYMMENGIEYNKNAYGVINVQRRIQTYYGKKYGLHYESVWEEGTTVTVNIPKREMEE